MYLLKLIANNGETATLEFNNYDEAVKMRESFMLMGQYSDAFVVSTCR
jgi:hypothetical protein